MRILQVSTYDVHGGAARVAWNLLRAYRARGYPSYMAVGFKESDAPDVLPIPNNRYSNLWARMWQIPSRMLQPLRGKVRGVGPLQRLFGYVGEPYHWLEQRRGIDDFYFPGTWDLLGLMIDPPDIIHCHNLHGDYFDLRALPWLSQQVCVVLTLHDAWLLSGHCAHSFDCERWKTGCGNCLDLTIYPAIARDKTAYNWQRKENIYVKSRLYVATPSRWLMRKLEQSMLSKAVAEARVIPNGVDVSIFRPTDRLTVRRKLGIPGDVRVILFMADSIQQKNAWKDYEMMRAAVAHLSKKLGDQRMLVIGLGEKRSKNRIGQAEIRFVPYQGEAEAVASYYQAADIYVHPACADTFPNAVLEALASATPVVATAVGGIPEQVKGLGIGESRFANAGLNSFGIGEATGILVLPRDAKEMARAIEWLIRDDAVRQQLSENAAQDACERFDLNRQVDTYLEWYQAIVEHTRETCF